MPWRVATWSARAAPGVTPIYVIAGPWPGRLYLDYCAITIHPPEIADWSSIGIAWYPDPTQLAEFLAIPGREAWGYQAGGVGTRSPSFSRYPHTYPFCRWSPIDPTRLRMLYEGGALETIDFSLTARFWTES